MLALTLIFLQAPVMAGILDPLAELDACNVIWDSPSQDAAGSMPIGNGEVGLNAWVEDNGDLVFYIARTDAWSECNRLLKLGRVRVRLTPSPWVGGAQFRQELKLRDGQMVITTGDMSLRVFVDADAPVIYVSGDSRTPRTVTATLESWRTEKRALTGQELASSWTMQEAPAEMVVSESADGLRNSPGQGVLVWHRNESSIVPLTLQHEGLESLAGVVHDPLLHRTFGARLSGRDFDPAGTNAIQSERPVTRFALAAAHQGRRGGGAHRGVVARILESQLDSC